MPAAAAALHTGMAVSIWSTTSLEDIAAAAPNGPKWLQLCNLFKEKRMVESLLGRAERAGYKGIFISIDGAAAHGKTYFTAENKHGLPKPYRYYH